MVQTSDEVATAPVAAPRERLLAAVIDYVVAHGIGDVSLRELAAAIGTSHRMLIYHFGSKEGLLVAVIQAVEQAQRQFLADMVTDATLAPAETIRNMWRRVADRGLWPNIRLFFEVYGQALQGRPGTTALLDDVVDAWLEPLTQFAILDGLPPAIARAEARLGLAVSRGLLLDLLATGDRAGADAALELYISHYEAVAGRGVAA